jgi:hypothetical protein
MRFACNMHRNRCREITRLFRRMKLVRRVDARRLPGPVSRRTGMGSRTRSSYRRSGWFADIPRNRVGAKAPWRALQESRFLMLWRTGGTIYRLQARRTTRRPELGGAPRSAEAGAYGLAASTCGVVNGSVRCTTFSVYSFSMSGSDKLSMLARMSVVSSPIDGAPRQIRPGVSDIFGTTP